MPVSFWLGEYADVDLAGFDAQSNSWPLTESLEPSSTLRRMIADVWFEVSHPNPDFESFLQAAGVRWTLIIWPALEPPPGGGGFPDPGPSALQSRMIAWGSGPGERTQDTPLGVHRYRFPGGGEPFHVDVQSQRLPQEDHGNPWVPWITWAFGEPATIFDDVTHARIRVNSTWLLERPHA